MKKIKHMIISLSTEKAFDKIKHPLMKKKNIQQTRNKKELSQPEKQQL